MSTCQHKHILEATFETPQGLASMLTSERANLGLTVLLREVTGGNDGNQGSRHIYKLQEVTVASGHREVSVLVA